jgi:hypothetical protein
MPADTLVSWRLTAERLQERIYELEAIARLSARPFAPCRRRLEQK